jgi:hypothetical protein
MKNSRNHKVLIGKVALLLTAMFSGLEPQILAANGGKTVNTAELRSEVNNFLSKELAAHLAAIKTLEPPPDRILNVPTTGEFSWGTFMRSLAAYAENTGNKELAGRDLAKWVGQIGLIEAKAGSKAFSQLYAALALRHFGRDLKTNPLWQALTPEEQTAWRSLLNPERFYNPQTNQVINLAENYLGVAARIASIGFDLGISNDRAFLDKLIDRAAVQFANGNLYADDSPPTGRYDRYSNEYARYVWEAAEMAGRQDILEKLTPSLKTQMRVWWDLVSEDGYGYNWGRSQGVVSYLDTPEIVGFLATHPKFRPAPLVDLAAHYYQAWKYLRNDYRDDAHLLSVFAFGRGNYAYITREREWQQTTGFFGKIANNHQKLMQVLDKEGVKTFPAVPSLPEVARFEFFQRTKERSAGVWLVRSGPLRFALPITTGPKPGAADYLPAPHGLAGFASPVEISYPSLTPFIVLADGRKLVATDGADEIEPATDGRSLRVRWSKLAVVTGKSGQFVDVGLRAEIVWRIENGTLSRVETLTSTQAVSIKHWQLVVPSSYANVQTETTNGQRSDLFSADGNSLDIRLIGPTVPVATSIFATGNSVLGKGIHGAIPLHLSFEARDFTVTRERPFKYRLDLTVKVTKK